VATIFENLEPGASLDDLMTCGDRETPCAWVVRYERALPAQHDDRIDA